uniref:Aminotransferase-like plant mobile domain-containing protein n=1 Tax=Fagus sylvatica TaxID=28930 RepID=A0A2N9G550_FAGSY
MTLDARVLEWMPQLPHNFHLGEDITILFWLEEHLSHRARNGEAVRSFMSQGNPMEPTETAKKSLLCVLAERWWDTIHTFHIDGVEMTITPYDVYRLIGLRVDRIVPTFSSFPAGVRFDREYLGISLGATFADLPTLMRAFAEAPQTTIEEGTRMARAFLLLPSTTWVGWPSPTSMRASTPSLEGATTSFVGPWRIWQRWALKYFTHTLARRLKTHQRECLWEFFDGLTLEQITWNAWVSINRMGSLAVDKRAYSWAQFSCLFKGPGASNEVILLWRASIPMLDRLDEDGDFEEYQQSLMPTLFPPPVADGSFRETAITRHADVLGYHVLADTLTATHANLNYMFQLCGNMKTMMTKLSRDCFSRPPGSSSRGAQADPEAIESDSDEDGGAPATQRGRHFQC